MSETVIDSHRLSAPEAAGPVVRSLSMPGLLAFLCGGGLLFAQWKFWRLTQDWPVFGRQLFQLAATALAAWGLYQLYQGLFPAPGKARVRRRNEHRVMLPTEGLVYLGIMSVLFVGSLLGRSNMLMLVFALMAGPFVLNGWITFSMLKHTRVGRELPERVMAGEPFAVRLSLANHRLWLSSWLMAVLDHISNGRERLDARVLFVRVPPRDSRSAPYHLRLMQRGVYQFGPVQVATRFPLGLVERGLVLDLPGRIIVYPRLGQLSRRWRRELLTATELVHRAEPRRGLFEDEFHRIREFRGGDNPRAIHWRTSARRNELMVREFQQNRDNDLAVLIDLWAPEPADAEARQRVELALSFAATVCVEFLQTNRDAELSLYTSGRAATDTSGRAAVGQIEPILDALAIVEPHPQPNTRQMLERWQRDRTARTRTLLVTTRPGGLHEHPALEEALALPDFQSEVQVLVAAPEKLEPYFEWKV